MLMLFRLTGLRCRDSSPPLPCLHDIPGHHAASRCHQGSGPCESMRLADFLAWWWQHRQQRQQQQQQLNGAPIAAERDEEEPRWYCKVCQQHAAEYCANGHPEVLVLTCCKQFVQVRASVTKPPSAMPLAHCPQDWHLASEFPGYQAYTCPAFFQDDWLNEWFDSQQQQQQEAAPAPQQADVDGQQQGPSAGGIQASDYRFVYLGPAVSIRKAWLPPCDTRAHAVPFQPPQPSCPPVARH